ncbi:MAG TPA: alpha/beta hydrolase [Bacteroidia bacterium]|nr:alpha/beta hydrolase [Bacteroidia bacterium]
MNKRFFLIFFFLISSAFAQSNKFGDNKEVGKFISINGIIIYYETYGVGEPLLLLHGNGQSIIDFENQIPEFSKLFKVIAVDSRAQGKSTDSKKELSYDLMADDMNELLDSLHLDSVNVVGWSDGGNTGLIIAMKYPGKVKKLAVMGANLYPDKTSVNIKDLREARRIKLLLSVLAFFSNQAEHDKKLIKMLLKYPKINPKDLRNVKVPTLVMAGDSDIIRESHTKLIANTIPNAQLVIFPNSSHFIPQENPNLFNQTVLNFLANP